MALTPEERTHLEEMGPAKVRFLASGGGLPTHLLRAAGEYLAEIEAMEIEDKRAEKAEQRQLVRSAHRAAWIGAWAAVIAVLVAIATIAITFWPELLPQGPTATVAVTPEQLRH